MTRLSLERIERASSLIDPVFLHSPQFDCEPLSQAVDARVLLKVETLNPIRSFKGRGAELLLAQTPQGANVITASAGNFGQAMAYAGRPRGVALTVYAAETAKLTANNILQQSATAMSGVSPVSSGFSRYSVTKVSTTLSSTISE